MMPPNGQEVSGPRWNMLQTVRDEIANTNELIEHIEADPGSLLHLSPSPEEEEITLLSCEIVEQLRRKVDIMESRWQDYDRLFTRPHSSIHPRR